MRNLRLLLVVELPVDRSLVSQLSNNSKISLVVVSHLVRVPIMLHQHHLDNKLRINLQDLVVLVQVQVLRQLLGQALEDSELHNRMLLNQLHLLLVVVLPHLVPSQLGLYLAKLPLPPHLDNQHKREVSLVLLEELGLQ